MMELYYDSDVFTYGSSDEIEDSKVTGINLLRYCIQSCARVNLIFSANESDEAALEEVQNPPTSPPGHSSNPLHTKNHHSPRSLPLLIFIIRRKGR